MNYTIIYEASEQKNNIILISPGEINTDNLEPCLHKVAKGANQLIEMLYDIDKNWEEDFSLLLVQND